MSDENLQTLRFICESGVTLGFVIMVFWVLWQSHRIKGTIRGITDIDLSSGERKYRGGYTLLYVINDYVVVVRKNFNSFPIPWGDGGIFQLHFTEQGNLRYRSLRKNIIQFRTTNFQVQKSGNCLYAECDIPEKSAT
jgi:hypothetical protein